MENLISVIYAVCGLSYTILAGKGKFICFIFGLISSILYSYLTFSKGLWGSFALNFLYYIPLQIISFIKWFQHTDKKRKTIIKSKLNVKHFVALVLIFSIISVIFSCFLKLKGDFAPYLDGLLTIFSILATGLTLRRVIEQWIIWSLVNVLSLVMWIKLMLNDYNCIPTVVLWFCYLVLGIYFYFQWKKELNSKFKN